MFETEVAKVITLLKPYFGERPIVAASAEHVAASWVFKLGLDYGDALLLARDAPNGHSFEFRVQSVNLSIEADSAETLKPKVEALYQEILHRVNERSSVRQQFGGLGFNRWSLRRMQ
jgi:hypothetical protein